jgi:hypothetical protein
MKKSSRSQGFLFVAGFALLLLALPLISLADTDIKTKISLVQSPLLYDQTTQTSYFEVSLKNISQDILLTPIKVVIDSVTPAGVTVKNADGITSDGKPYFNYNLASGTLVPNQVTGNRKWIFSNPSRLRFSYSIRILGNIPDAASTIGTLGGVVEVTNLQSGLYGMKLSLPEGAVDSDSIITISEVVHPISNPFGDNEYVAPAVEIRSSLGLNRFVKVQIPLTSPLGKHDLVVITHYDKTNNTWMTIPAIYPTEGSNYLEFFTASFSEFSAIKFSGLPPSDQLNLDIFMRNIYPIIIQQVKRAELEIDKASDVEKKETILVENSIDAMKGVINQIDVLRAVSSGIPLTEIKDLSVDAVLGVYDLIYSLNGEESKQWIDPLVDMASCTLDGLLKSIINKTPPVYEVSMSCALDAIKNCWLTSVRFFYALPNVIGGTKIINENWITIDYMQLFYSTGGDLIEMASLTEAKGTTEDDIINAVAQNYKRGWLSFLELVPKLRDITTKHKRSSVWSVPFSD